MFKLSTSFVSFAAAAILVGGLSSMIPVQAAPHDTSEPPLNDFNQSTFYVQPAAAPVATPAPNKKTLQALNKHTQSVEGRIKFLHDSLKITSAQEEEWGTVAKTIRENEASMSQLVEARHQNAGYKTAIDDLQSYADITQAHADGVKNLLVVFESLYTDLSAEQKKAADNVFGSFQKHHEHHTAKKTK